MILRICHGLTNIGGQVTNGALDMKVPENFNFNLFVMEVHSMGYFNNGTYMIPWQWIQHCVLLTDEQHATLTSTDIVSGVVSGVQGMTKQ